MARTLIGLGSNLGDRAQRLEQALTLLDSEPDCTLLRRSAWYQTQAIGGPADQPAFLNGAAVIETTLDPEPFHARLLSVEARLGRRREVRWAPRTIDLDLLLYDDRVIELPDLVVPHPRMVVRRFVLVPGAEIAADWLHPTLGWTLGRLLDHIDHAAAYLAMTGPAASGKTTLAGRLAAAGPAAFLADPLELPLVERLYADPVGQGLAIEQQIVSSRIQTLGQIVPGRAEWTVSDFWIGQSRAFAHAFLSPDQAAAFDNWWEDQTAQTVAPRLLVALDAPGEELHRRVVRRGHACDRALDVGQLERLRAAFTDQLAHPWGPQLRLAGLSLDEAEKELRAALVAMNGPCLPVGQ